VYEEIWTKDLKILQRSKQIEMVDLIAYPDRAKGKPELTQGVAFFNKMRDLTVNSFYTTKIGLKIWVTKAIHLTNGMVYLMMY